MKPHIKLTILAVTLLLLLGGTFLQIHNNENLEVEYLQVPSITQNELPTDNNQTEETNKSDIPFPTKPVENDEGHITAQKLAACLMETAQIYDVPPAVLIGIMGVEGGSVGTETKLTKDGSYTLGAMKIKSQILPQLAQGWQVDENTAHKWVRDNACANVQVAAWILKQKVNKSGSLYIGIAQYHSDNPSLGRTYAAQVIQRLKTNGLLKSDDVLLDQERE